MRSKNDEAITFTLGKGSQSAICGGVTPAKVSTASHPESGARQLQCSESEIKEKEDADPKPIE